MREKELKNKPLVGAIFELRWQVKEQLRGVRGDPHYKLIIGRLYDRFKKEYPFNELLPSATIPDEIIEKKKPRRLTPKQAYLFAAEVLKSIEKRKRAYIEEEARFLSGI